MQFIGMVVSEKDNVGTETMCLVTFKVTMVGRKKVRIHVSMMKLKHQSPLLTLPFSYTD